MKRRKILHFVNYLVCLFREEDLQSSHTSHAGGLKVSKFFFFLKAMFEESLLVEFMKTNRVERGGYYFDKEFCFTSNGKS
jgi:hypothetical protein